MAASTLTVLALRDHYGPRGMVMAGAEIERSAEDAAYLVSQGVVRVVTPPAPAVEVKARRERTAGGTQ